MIFFLFGDEGSGEIIDKLLSKKYHRIEVRRVSDVFHSPVEQGSQALDKYSLCIFQVPSQTSICM